MNIVERFITEEDLEGVVLENCDFSDIGLGIILGNIEKVQFHPEFCMNLRIDTKIHPIIKAVFLKRILQKLFYQIENFNVDNKHLTKVLMQQFNDVSNLLIEIFDYAGEFKSLITSTYTELFRMILKKFSVADDLVSIPINAYKLKNILNLKSSFFLLPLEDLQLFQQRNFQNPQLFFNLLSRSCEIVFQNQIIQSDELSIIAFNSFYYFLTYLLENDIGFDYKKIIEVLIKYHKNFTYRQRARFREFYNKLRDLNIIYSDIENFIGVYSLEPDYQARKISHDPYRYKKNSFEPAPKPPIRFDNKNRCNLAPKYNDHGIERTKREPNEEIDKSVKSSLVFLINTLKYYAKDQEIDDEILECNIRDLMNISLDSLHYNLAYFSFYEQDFSHSSLLSWNSVLRAVKKIENYPKLELKQLEYYIEYLNSSN